MKVRTVHERELETAPEAVDELIERTWPKQWPRLRDDLVGFLRHEPLRREPDLLSFSITGPRGFSGWHGWAVERENGHAVLRHVVEAHCRGWVRLGWPLVIRPIHDALHEDVLDRAAGATSAPRWSWRVRFLRWAIRKAGLRR